MFAYIATQTIHKKNNLPWLWANTLLVPIYLGLVNVAHWLFSYEYYNMVRIIPFVLDDISPL
jgi:hypothetical protein